MADRIDREVHIGLLGFGTVGSSVFSLLQDQADEITEATGALVNVKRILVRDATLPRSDAPAELLTDDFEEIIDDDEISVIVELIGGTEPAFDFVTAALEKGKAVVTANKQLLSQQGTYLFELARKNDTMIRFEASVTGAVPVIRVISESLVAADFTSVHGIVNGTTNYILSEMIRTGARYEDALARAQEWGYAEADPTEDISGKDAAAKMAILAMIAFHSEIRLDDVACVGIENISSVDIAYAVELGMTLKLLGVAKLYDGKVNVRVYPALLDRDHPLASVNGAYNAVFLKGSAIDEIMLSGPGAGGVETASAVVGDITSIIARPKAGILDYPRVHKDIELFPDDDVVSTFYLRLEVEDQPGVLAQIAQVFGENKVSIESVLQKGRGQHAELVMVFHPVREMSFAAALASASELPVVKGDPVPIRVERDHEH